MHSLTANYAARINRPGISYLNPERSYTPTTLSYGNPDLSSAFSNSLKLQYAFYDKHGEEISMKQQNDMK